MINAGLFNQLVNAFSIGTDVAFANLALYSLGLLGAFGLLHFYISMSLGLTGYIPLGEALARFLWTLVKIGIFYWIITNLYDLLWGGLFLTFAKWGADAGGGFGLTDFLNPSAIVTQGFKAAYPVKVWVDQFIGPLLPLYGIDVGLGLFAYVLTVFSFVCIALHVLMTLIEFKLALATSAVLLPWAVFTHTAFVGELAISWLVAGLVRILVTGIITGIATTLFDVLTVPVPTLAGPDPTVFQALSLAAGAFVFAVLAWVVPNHAASIGGRGMALALTGEHLVSGGMAGISGVRYLSQIGGGAIRGVSKLAA
jgi:type IV secretion system protein TrbL